MVSPRAIRLLDTPILPSDSAEGTKKPIDLHGSTGSTAVA